MIKVLEKTFDILEEIVISSPHPMRVSELAECFGINQGTCTRILKQLLDAGYLMQVSRQHGYTVGPRALTFAKQVSYKKELLTAAELIMENVASELKASVLLCERIGLERYILVHKMYCRKLNIVLKHLSEHDIFSTATGLILAAYASPGDREILMREYKNNLKDLLPAKQSTREALKEIHDNGVFVSERHDSEQGIMACPVFRNGKMIATLGASVEIEYFMDKAYRKKFIEKIKRSAGDLSKTISYINIAG